MLSSSAVRLLAAFDMYQYTTAEMTDMDLAYGKAVCNVRAAARLYAERFPNRHTPHHFSFAAIQRRLRKAGKFHYVHSRVTCACYMYTSKYCTTVVSIFYNVFPLLGAKTSCGSSTFDSNISV